MNQIAIGNKSSIVKTSEGGEVTLKFWFDVYFAHAVTAVETSKKVQIRDIPDCRGRFKDFLRTSLKPDGRHFWSDRTNNRMLAHIKTFARWIHQFAPFPLGNPIQ